MASADADKVGYDTRFVPSPAQHPSLLQGSDNIQSTPRVAAEWSEPTRYAAAWHSLKVFAHVIRRSVQNVVKGPRRITPARDLVNASVVAEHRSPLWADGREDEFILRCGKVQNLRVAVRQFDGVEVRQGQLLSFWSQLGRPAKTRGYAIGREIVNGCVVPTVGGGLCQLSNALADVAAIAGICLAEHHRHSALIEQQAAPATDATVAWNHIDLRMVAEFAFRIEAYLTHDELVVRLRSAKPRHALQRRLKAVAVQDERAVARGCVTCDQASCFRHRHRPRPLAARSAYLLNEPTAEMRKWLELRREDVDWMVPWVRPRRRHLTWVPPGDASVQVALWPSLRRIARQRLQRGEGGARQAGRNQAALDLAEHYSRALRPEHIDLVVSQDLLVPLWRTGALAGRAYDVFVSELPASEIQRRLDEASETLSRAPSLRDFRVEPKWLADEWAALNAARSLATSHSEVHKVLQASGLVVELVPWIEPANPDVFSQVDRHHPTLAFAASALARKGSHEVATVARRLGARVLILGSPPGNPELWSGVNWSVAGYRSDWLRQSDVAVLPAYIEHQPRALLQALAAGLPVVASTACGLGSRSGVTTIEAGDAVALESAVRNLLASRGRGPPV